MAEALYFVDGGGTEYQIHNTATSKVHIAQNFGLPEIEHITQRTPFQHGEQWLDYRWRPRVVNLTIRRIATTRQGVYDDHRTLVSMFRPDRGLGKLKYILPDGSTERRLDVYYMGGLTFNSDEQNAGLEQLAAIQLIAHSPFWYNPTATNTDYVMSASASYFFDFSFPFELPPGGIVVTQTINNAGDVNEYPEIRITGPGVDPEIKNITLNKKISISYTIPAGQTIIVDMDIGAKTIVLDDGVTQTNIIGYLSSDSEFWHLRPGNNNVRGVVGSGTDTNSLIRVTHYNRYLGL